MGRPAPHGDRGSEPSLPALDGVRGLAIALVMAFHIGRVPATAIGWSGVDLFFVLSGFLITGILYRSRNVPARARTFYARRALRILPLYYVVIFAVFVVRPFLGWSNRLDDVSLAGEQFWYWTYLADWRIALGHPRGFTFLTHFWSLSIEEQFYLFWPLLVWNLSRRTALRAAIGITIGSFILRLTLARFAASSGMIYALLPCRIDALAVGAIAFLATAGQESRPKRDVVRRRIYAVGGVGAIVLTGLGLARHSVSFADPAMVTFGLAAIDWAYAAIVLFAATERSAILEWGPLRMVGRYAYGLYVYPVSYTHLTLPTNREV